MSDKVFTAKEVARMLKLSERWIKQLANNGRLQRLAAGSPEYKFKASTVRQFVTSNGMHIPPELEPEKTAS